MNNTLLTRYWFKTKRNFGFGVTAYSIEDARNLLSEFFPGQTNEEPIEVIENVDLSILDANHVLPTVGPSNLPGVWYPCLNL